MRCIHLGDTRGRCGRRRVLEFFPELKGLIAGAENPRRHQRLLVRALRLALEIGLPEVYPGPVSFLEFSVAAGEIAGFEQDISVNQERYFVWTARKRRRRRGKNLGLSPCGARAPECSRGSAVRLRRSIIHNDDLLGRPKIRCTRTQHLAEVCSLLCAVVASVRSANAS